MRRETARSSETLSHHFDPVATIHRSQAGATWLPRRRNVPRSARHAFLALGVGAVLLLLPPTLSAQEIPQSSSAAQTLWDYPWTNRQDDIERLHNTFAAGRLITHGHSVCNGFMVSPHLYMTAAHCGITEYTAEVYFDSVDVTRGASPDSHEITGSYDGRGAWWRSFKAETGGGDIGLFWMEAVDGVPPGIRYGYLELSPSEVRVGDEGYSIWLSRVGDVNGTPILDTPTVLYSPGVVEGLEENDWRGPTSRWNILGVPGASGSAVLGTGRHRNRVVGVTSKTEKTPKRYRGAASITHILKKYDADGNDVMDAIEYDWLGQTYVPDFARILFASHLERSFWRLPGSDRASNPPRERSEVIRRYEGTVRNEPKSTKWTSGLWNNRVRFRPKSTYRITVFAKAEQPVVAGVRLKSDRLRSSETFEFAPVKGQYRRFTGLLRTGDSSDYSLVLGSTTGQGPWITQGIGILRDGAPLNFETDAERRSWEYRLPSRPTSWGIGGKNDFSGLVIGSEAGKWAVRNRWVALAPNSKYRVSFRVRHVDGPLGENLLRVETLGERRVAPGGVRSWTFKRAGQILDLTHEFATDSEGGYTVAFIAPLGAQWMVDDVVIRTQ